jgi:hypothetical protein
MRQGRLYRWFAVLFLLFASAEILVDVISPGICCEELSGFVSSCAPGAADPAQAPDGLDKISAVDNSTHGEPSSPFPTEEECFCCCAHILPSLHFEVADLDVESLTSDLANTILPIAPPQSAYHPPRLS